MPKHAIIGHVDHEKTTLTAAISLALAMNEPIKTPKYSEITEVSINPFEQEPVEFKITSSYSEHLVKETRAQRRKRERKQNRK